MNIRLINLLLIAVLAFSVSSCGLKRALTLPKKHEAPNEKVDQKTQKDNEKIGDTKPENAIPEDSKTK